MTNLGDPAGCGIGCVEVSIPGAFELKEVKLVSVPSGKHWKTGQSGGSGSSRVAEYRAEQDDDVLAGGEIAVFKVKVKAASAGAFMWTAQAWSSRSCDGGSFVSVPLAIVVGPNPTPPPAPTPTPTPTPRPTPMPTPTPTPPANADPDAHPCRQRHGRPRRPTLVPRRPRGRRDPDPDARSGERSVPQPSPTASRIPVLRRHPSPHRIPRRHQHRRPILDPPRRRRS